MHQPNSRLMRWRKRLKTKDVKKLIPNSAVAELCAIAKQQVQFYFRTPKRLSPSALSRELNQLAKGLGRAVRALEIIGSQGLVRLYAASCANLDLDDFSAQSHSAYILQMSRWAQRAAIVADKDTSDRLLRETTHPARSIEGKRGPTPDLVLRSLVVVLAHQYAVLLALEPKNTRHVETSEGTSLFNEFVKAAIADYAPADAAPKWMQIDEAIRHELPWMRRFSTLLSVED